MQYSLDLLRYALNLLFKAVALAASWAGTKRQRALKEIASMNIHEKDKEIFFLRHENTQLKERLDFFLKQLKKGPDKERYSIKEKLFVIFQMQILAIPRRHVTKFFGVSRSTFYKWLHNINDSVPNRRPPANKTPARIAALVWNIARENPAFGKVKIAGCLTILHIFLSASTVRNILDRPKPPSGECITFIPDKKFLDAVDPKPIPALFPNHIWSVDLCEVRRWGLYKTFVLLAIDHFSRKILTVQPLEGPNAAWTVQALEHAFRKFGPPKHIISDQGSVFTGKSLVGLCEKWNIEHRFGAVGKHGSIAVTERAIKTLKYEWLKRVPLIRGFDHLQRLCADFSLWYNAWRPHMLLQGFRPDDYYRRDIPEPIPKDAKTVPLNIEKRKFKDTRITGYRLKQAA